NEHFTLRNMREYNAVSTAPINRRQAFANQRNCDTCHAGCLDCHYTPFNGKAVGENGKPNAAGVHTFSFSPPVLSCMGGGRALMCHAPLERRRGDGFMKGAFARKAVADPDDPNSKKYIDTPDAHYAAGITCVDCHLRNRKTGGMGDLIRNPEPSRCAGCHEREVIAHGRGVHKNLSCEACHTPLVAGYAFNFWAPGTRFGIKTPLDRHQFYNANAMTPILIRNRDGQWDPFHIVPHIASNVKREEVRLSGRLIFRSRPDVNMERHYPSSDAFAVTGVYESGGDEGAVMAWLNVDRVAHAITKSRGCDSCHGAGGAQRVPVDYKWMSHPGAAYRDVLDGHYTIEADGKGLRIEDITGDDGKTAPAGLKPLEGKWDLHGDFSIPAIKDKKEYEKKKRRYEQILKTGGQYHF
ncbi:MAG: cytochrome c3 family protein, partial [Nitrospiraceae bacterium]|nr:cytochrome c3 family protein [Nitrospiraceae bacterium]